MGNTCSKTEELEMKRKNEANLMESNDTQILLSHKADVLIQTRLRPHGAEGQI